MQLSAQTRQPSEQAVFPRLTVVLLAASKFFAAWFFVYRVTSTTDTQISTRISRPRLVSDLILSIKRGGEAGGGGGGGQNQNCFQN
uniref:Uncharacterized protein n=1 Tax=Equus asinus asinus TaxID=83772 RepID=A0A8C4LCV4_EQUAS